MTTHALVAESSRSELLDRLSLASLIAFVAAIQISIAVAHIFLTLVVICWLALVITHREHVEVPAIAWPLGAYAIITLVSATFSADPAHSFLDCKQLVLFLIVPIVYRLVHGSRATTITNVIITVGAVSAIIGIVQYGILQFDNLGRRPQGALTHYMTYSGSLMLVIGATAARLLYSREDRAWPALVAPALLVALALTFTRSAWVGACTAVAVLLMVRDRRLAAVVPVAAALFVVIAPEALANRVYSTFDLNDPTNRDRVAMLRYGVEMVRDHPLTGIGPDMVKEVYSTYRDAQAVQPLNPHLHNVPLQIAAERGLLALGIFLWFVFVAARDLIRKLNTSPGPVAAAGLAALVAMLAAGMFEYNFGDSEFLMLFLVLITLPYATDAGHQTADHG